MHRFPAGLFFLTMCWSTVCSHPEIVDLSHQHKPGLVVWPGLPTLNFTIMQRGLWGDTGLWVEYNKFQTPEHYGTHVDVPAHFAKGKWRLHQVPIKQFMGPAVVIDITERAKTDRDTRVLVSDLESWERKYGEIPERAIVLMRSDWSKKYSDAPEYLGTEIKGNQTILHFPGFHEDAITWLIENRPTFNGIGVDTISTDHGPAQHFPVHTALLGENKIGYENLANLAVLPESGAMFYAAPISLYDGSGCPVRAFGIYNTDTGGSTSPALTQYLIFVAVMVWYCVI